MDAKHCMQECEDVGIINVWSISMRTIVLNHLQYKIFSRLRNLLVTLDARDIECRCIDDAKWNSRNVILNNYDINVNMQEFLRRKQLTYFYLFIAILVHIRIYSKSILDTSFWILSCLNFVHKIAQSIICLDFPCISSSVKLWMNTTLWNLALFD